MSIAKIVPLTAEFVKLRDEIAELESAHKVTLAPLKERKLKLEQLLAHALENADVTSVRTDYGTVIRKNTYAPRVVDWEAFYSFVLREGHISFLTKTLHKANLLAYIDTTGVAPPGVTGESIMSVQIRRS